MAEVVGIIASSISIAGLAAQVTSSIFKVKDYWKQIKEVPDDVQCHLFQLELLVPILQHIQNQQAELVVPHSAFDNNCLSQVLNHCNDSVKGLESLLREMSQKTEGKIKWRKNIGAAKVMLKRKQMEQLDSKLKSAVELLKFAYQCQTDARIQYQTGLISQMLVTGASLANNALISTVTTSNSQEMNVQYNETSTINVLATSPNYYYYNSSSSWLALLLGSLEYEQTTRKKRGKTCQEVNARYHCPAWLSHRLWHITGHATLGGWQLNFRTYRVVSWRNPLFEGVRKGNLEQIRHLLVTKQAFITDVDPHEYTALHIAAAYGQFEACKLLLFEGADASAINVKGETPLCSNVSSIACNINVGGARMWDVLRLLVHMRGSDELVDDLNILIRFRGPVDMFQFLQQAMYPPYSEWPAESRLGSEGLSREIVIATDCDGSTLLYYLAIQFKIFDFEYLSDVNCPWRVFIRECVASGALLHALDCFEQSPLYFVIEASLYMLNFKLRLPSQKHFRQSTKLITFWLLDLQTAGVNLELYGSVEHAIFLNNRDKFFGSRRSYSFVDGWSVLYETRLIGFSYGPLVEDWHFRFSEPSDEFVGDFWRIVEHDADGEKMAEDTHLEQQSIPGSWVS